MKKSFIILLVCALLFIFSSCGGNTSADSSDSDDDTSAVVKGADTPEELVGKLEELYTLSEPDDNKLAVLTYEYVFAKKDAEKTEFSSHSASIINNLREQYGDDLQVSFSDVEIHIVELPEDILNSLRSALSVSYNDTDKIEELCDVSYNWKATGSSGGVADSVIEHYIKVGDKWYLFDTYAEYSLDLGL